MVKCCGKALKFELEKLKSSLGFFRIYFSFVRFLGILGFLGFFGVLGIFSRLFGIFWIIFSLFFLGGGGGFETKCTFFLPPIYPLEVYKRRHQTQKRDNIIKMCSPEDWQFQNMSALCTFLNLPQDCTCDQLMTGDDRSQALESHHSQTVLSVVVVTTCVVALLGNEIFGPL